MEITDQEKKLLALLQQIKLEGEVHLGLDPLLKSNGINSYTGIAVVLRSQGFILNRSTKARESILVWNRNDPPNIKMVKAIIAENKKRQSNSQSKSYNNKLVKNSQVITEKKEEKSVELLALEALHEKAVKDFETAKDKLSKIVNLIKLYN